MNPLKLVIEETIEMGVVVDTVETSALAREMKALKAKSFKEHQLRK